jgi:Uncharacterised nucleotidyltransferase
LARSSGETFADSSRFAWLLSPNGVPLDDTPSLEEVEAACEFALRAWRVLPVTAPRLRGWAGEALPREYEDQLVDLKEAVALLARVQTMLAGRLTKALDAEGVPYTLLKSSALRLSTYPRPDDRGSLDVDVAVPAARIREAEALAHELGFTSSMLVGEGRKHYQPAGRAVRAAVEAQHYELATLVRQQVITGLEPEVETAVRRSIPALLPWHEIDGQVACYVTIDLHHGLSLDIASDEIVASARRSETRWGSAFVPAPYWQVFHLIFKIYWEGVHNYRKGAYQYADLTRLLLPRLTEGDVEALIELLDAYRLQAAAYYVLRRVEPHFGVGLPESLAQYVAAQARSPDGVYPHEVNDLGDMWPKLWGIR